MTRLIALSLGVAAAWLLSCSLDFSWRGESPSYLEETRPACTPIHGSSVDPCERRDDWIVRLYPPVYASGYISKPDLPIDVEARFRRMWDRGESTAGLMTPQIVIRGIVLPKSPRCVEFGDYVLGLYDDGPAYEDSDRAGEVCFVDVAVSEHIVGDGPETLPIVVGWTNGVLTTVEEYGTVGYYARVAEPIEDEMGGFEFVIRLARPVNMAWAEWGLVDAWDVQRRSDGEVIAQHELYSLTGSPEDKPQYEYPLTDLQQKIRDAHAKLSIEFDGRIGADAADPKLVSDANRTFLLAQLRELGAYDVPGIPPIAAPAYGAR